MEINRIKQKTKRSDPFSITTTLMHTERLIGIKSYVNVAQMHSKLSSGYGAQNTVLTYFLSPLEYMMLSITEQDSQIDLVKVFGHVFPMSRR